MRQRPHGQLLPWFEPVRMICVEGHQHPISKNKENNMREIVSSTNEITPAWLTEVLQSRGLLKSSVSDADIEIIGEGVGLMGELARLRLSYADDEDLPPTMIAKTAIQSENIQVARILDFYNREVNFYNHYADLCGLNVPASYYGAVDQETYDCVLLMEDLGNVSPRDQVIGGSAEEAESAIKRIAGMHSRWWGKADDDWLYPMTSDAGAEPLQNMLYQPSVDPTIEKFREFLDDKSISLLKRVGDTFPEYWSRHMQGTDTFIHGDFRQDNMIYPENSLDAKIIDWQISGRGKSVFDITYFMCQSLPATLRRDIEKDLIQMYIDELNQHGVTDYSVDACWQDYRRMILGCLVYPVTVCGSLDLANERGRALAECMLERNLAAIDELNCAEFVQ